MSSKEKISSPTTYGLPEFEELKISTRTFMVYANMEFNLGAIFRHAKITPIEIPLTKRKKNIDRKKLKASRGSIVSMQYLPPSGNEGYIRGIDTRKIKKHWCTSCRLTVVDDSGKTTKILTVVEEVKKCIDPEITKHDDLYKIHYFCRNCSHYYTPKDLNKIPHFLNQVTIVLSIGDILLNIMNFRNSLKIAGCKQDEDAYAGTKILWENFYQSQPTIWTIMNGDVNANFIIRRVMCNVGFNLGFSIDLNKLNTLMNKEEYNNIVDVSQRETTGHPNVNISMHSNKPEDFLYDMIVYKEKGNVSTVEQVKDNPYEKKKETKSRTTFIVFSSSQIILSGRYTKEMKTLYNFFINEVLKNKNNLQEKLRSPDNDILSFLGKMEGGMIVENNIAVK